MTPRTTAATLFLISTSGCLVKGRESGPYYDTLVSSRGGTYGNQDKWAKQARNPLRGPTLTEEDGEFFALDLAGVEDGRLCFDYEARFPTRAKARDVLDALRPLRFVTEAHTDPEQPELRTRPLLPATAEPRPFERVELVESELKHDLVHDEKYLWVHARLCSPPPAGLTPEATVLTVTQLDKAPLEWQPCGGHSDTCVWFLTP